MFLRPEATPEKILKIVEAMGTSEDVKKSWQKRQRALKPTGETISPEEFADMDDGGAWITAEGETILSRRTKYGSHAASIGLKDTAETKEIEKVAGDNQLMRAAISHRSLFIAINSAPTPHQMQIVRRMYYHARGGKGFYWSSHYNNKYDYGNNYDSFANRLQQRAA